MNFIKERYLNYFLIAVSLIYLSVITYLSFNYLGCWSDEIFSFRMVQLPFDIMMAEAISDVHPPLYYLMYKFLVEFFKIFSYNNIIVIGRILSLIPTYLLIIFNFTKIKKDFGIKAACLFTLFLVSMPKIALYSLEIRMYNWTILFLTLSLVYVYEILKEGSYKKWACLTFLTVCSAYTHYFAAVTSFSLYLFLLIYIIIKNKNLVKKYIISALICIIAYIPWICPLIQQVTTVGEGYWIEPMTFNAFLDMILCIVSPETIRTANTGILQFKIIPIILSIAALLAMLYLITGNIKKRNLKINTAFLGVLVFASVPVIGIIISQLFRPIFCDRYIVPAIGMLWLAISILLSNCENKKVFTLILIVFLVIGAVTTSHLVENQKNLYNNVCSEYDALNTAIGSGNTLVIDNYMAYVNFDTLLLPDNFYIVLTNKTSHAESVDYQKNKLLNRDVSILKTINGDNVYYIDIRSDNENDLVSNNISFEKLDINVENPTYKKYTIYKISNNG